MNIAVLVVLAITLNVPSAFSKAADFSSTPQKDSPFLSAWVPPDILHASENECGDSNNDGLCDDNGAQD